MHVYDTLREMQTHRDAETHRESTKKEEMCIVPNALDFNRIKN